MKKNKASLDEIRPEYDFSKGVRGRHAAKYAEWTNFVRLDADVNEVFKNSEAVNAAVRGLLRRKTA